MPGELRAMQRPHAADRCQARNPSTCKFHGSTPDAAVNRGDINAFLDAKAAEDNTNAMKGFFGVNEESLIIGGSIGIDGGSSYVQYDSFNLYMKHYGHKDIHASRPTNDIESAIFDKAKEALGSDTNVIVRNVRISKGSTEGDSSGKIVFGTAQSPEMGLLDGVEYGYTKTDGNITFYKKTMLGKKDLTNELIQADIIAARKHYNRVQQSMSASSG